MPSPWSLPTSLRSVQRIQRVSPVSQVNPLMLPPRSATSPSTLPLIGAALAPVVGELQSKFPPGVVHVATSTKDAPRPYSRTIAWADVFPPLRHCSPSKPRVNWLRVPPELLVAANAIQPAIAPLAGLPK